MKKIFFSTTAIAAFVSSQALAIVQGGCTEHQGPITVSSSLEECLPDITIDECELVPAAANTYAPEGAEIASFIIVCWRDNYVEESYAGCAVI